MAYPLLSLDLPVEPASLLCGMSSACLITHFVSAIPVNTVFGTCVNGFTVFVGTFPICMCCLPYDWRCHELGMDSPSDWFVNSILVTFS